LKTILVDLDRCIGCYACEIACKDENDLTPGVRRVKVRQVDRGKHDRFYVPTFELDKRGVEGCTLCPQLQSEGRAPACVANCITNALQFGDFEEIKEKTATLKSVTATTLHARGEVIYASRKPIHGLSLEG
jgi:Fe-S-cluster-containing dehydrogenase component